MKCFVIMPFAAAFNDVYDAIRLAVENAVAGQRVTCYRLDELKGAGRITDRLVRELSEAVVCIADVTGVNANVMWEVGYAMALGKPTLLLSQDAGLPFDLKDMQTVFYTRDALADTLRKPLGEAFRHTLGSYEVRTEARRAPLAPKTQFTVAVTGSMEARHERTRRRLEVLLQPYLSENTSWLVGSWGDVDELTIEFLAQHKQRVIVVGYDSFDISPRALELTEQHGLQFLPAHEEQLPKGISSGSNREASNRDLLFLTRADLIVLLWDGKSEGTKWLLKWYRDQGKDHVVAFA